MAGGRDVFRIEADTRGFVQAYDRARRSQDKLTKSFTKGAKEGRKADKAIGGIVSHAGAMGVLAAGAGVLVKAISAAEQEATAAAGRIRNLIGEIRDLNQLASDSLDLQSGEALAKAITIATGIPEKQSIQLVVQGRQAGLSDIDIQQSGRLGLIENDPAGTVRRAADIQAAFPAAGGGSFLGILNSLGVAQGPSASNLAGLASIVLGPGKIAKELGGTIEESLATVAISTVGSESPERASTQAKAFFGVLNKDSRFRGGAGLLDDLKQFAALSDPERRGILKGNQEAMLGAASIIPRIDKIEALFADIQGGIRATGTDKSFLALKSAQALRNPRLATDFATRRAEAAVAQSEESSGIFEARQDAVIAAIKASQRRRGFGPANRFIQAAVLGVEDFLGSSPEALAETERLAILFEGNSDLRSQRDAERFLDPIRGIIGEDFKRNQAEHTKALREHAEALRKTSGASGIPRPIVRQPG